MAEMIDDVFAAITSRRRDCRMRRDDTMATLGMVGTGIKAGAQIGQGYNAKGAGEFEAGQHERSAVEARAAGAAAAREKQSELARVVSKQRAVAAASGAGGVETPSVLDIFGDTVQRGEYLKNIETFKGESRARDEINKANAARMKGENAYVGSILEGVSTGLGGVVKYGKGAGKTAEASTTPSPAASADSSIDPADLDLELEDEKDYQRRNRTVTYR